MEVYVSYDLVKDWGARRRPAPTTMRLLNQTTSSSTRRTDFSIVSLQLPILFVI
jgi:hypothetical protein